MTVATSAKTLLLALAVALSGCGGPEQRRAAGQTAISLETRVASAPWLAGRSTGEILTTRHYRIFTTARRPALLRYLPGFMEAAHRQYLSLTGLAGRTDNQPLPIYMMGTRAEWALLTKKIAGPQRDILLSIEAGGYFRDGVCVFWDSGPTTTFSVAAHEGLHQFLHYRLKDRLPMWLEEGLCVSAEGHQITNGSVRFTPDRNPFRFSSLRRGILRGYWLPIAELLPMDAGDAVAKGTDRAVSYYAQLWVLSIMLRTGPDYRRGFDELISDAEAGRFAESLGLPPGTLSLLSKRGRAYNRKMSAPLFRHYITDDLDAFDREYLAFARRFARLD